MAESSSSGDLQPIWPATQSEIDTLVRLVRTRKVLVMKHPPLRCTECREMTVTIFRWNVERQVLESECSACQHKVFG